MTTVRANADVGKLFIAQINKAESLLNEREWKNSAHTDLECAALAWLGRAGGLLLSLPALGEGNRDQIPAVWQKWGCGHSPGLGCQGQFWFHTNVNEDSVSAPRHGWEWRCCPVPAPEGVCCALGQGLRGMLGLAWGRGVIQKGNQSTSTCPCHRD